MPNDLYMWEDRGGLVHHCPKCFKPLTTPQARSRCLGEHVEWCKNYHTQLFKKGTSTQCDPCRRSDEEHEKRHREIAELLLDLKKIKGDQAITMPASPSTPKAIKTLHLPIEDTPSSKKKDRKAAKKAKKVSEMAKVVSTADIEVVTAVLHPHAMDTEEEDLERKLLEDPDIKLNRFFHRGTSNRRDIRNDFVAKDRHNTKSVDIKIEDSEIGGLLQLLNVSPITAPASAKVYKIHAKLVEKIKEDIVHVHKETEQMMMRKAGFWRWASKKAYNRLVQNGRIWGKKDGDASSGKSSGATSSSSSSAATDAEEEDAETETDTDATSPLSNEDAVEDKMAALAITADTKSTPDPSTPKDDGWTTVGRPSYASTVKRPVGQLKLVGNGGLTKLVSSPTTAKKGGRVARLYYEQDE